MLLVACGSTASPSPTVTTTPFPPPTAPTPTVAPVPTPAATVLAFPHLSEVALAAGRYDSSPPFDIPFTFVLFEEGWESAHLHGEFFDVMKLNGPDPVGPTRWIAWAHPATIHGATAEPAAGMTPDEAASLVAGRTGVEPGPISLFEIDGLAGVRIDLHADAPSTHIFGGSDGDFGLEPNFDARLGIVPVGSDLLLVLVLASPAELEDAWADAQPILASIDL